MCRERKVKQLGRCKTCMESRCLTCGQELTILVRTVNTVKFRKKQWEHSLYEHSVLIKTRTFDKVCTNPDCTWYRNPENLLTAWIVAPAPKVEAKKKSLDQVLAEVEKEAFSP